MRFRKATSVTVHMVMHEIIPTICSRLVALWAPDTLLPAGHSEFTLWVRHLPEFVAEVKCKFGLEGVLQLLAQMETVCAIKHKERRAHSVRCYHCLSAAVPGCAPCVATIACHTTAVIVLRRHVSYVQRILE